VPEFVGNDVLPEQLEERLAEALGIEAIDRFAEGEGVSVATDEWTLHFAADGGIWLAIDLEPDDASQLRAAWRSALGPEVEQILAEINQLGAGALVSRLTQSPDPLSNDLAEALRLNAE